MKKSLFAFVVCISLAAVLAYAQGGDEGYQMAKVVAFEKVASDAQHMENAGQYKIAMRLGDTTYNCRATGDAATFLDWTVGKQFPTKVNEKTLTVKNPNGQLIEMKITGKKTQK